MQPEIYKGEHPVPLSEAQIAKLRTKIDELEQEKAHLLNDFLTLQTSLHSALESGNVGEAASWVRPGLKDVTERVVKVAELIGAVRTCLEHGYVPTKFSAKEHLESIDRDIAGLRAKKIMIVRNAEISRELCSFIE